MEHPNVGADRNLFIQTGELNNSQHEQERVPVAGGNENFMIPGTGSGNNAENLSNQVNDLPMHRLVLGESDPNPRFITGSNAVEEQRSEAIGNISEKVFVTTMRWRCCQCLNFYRVCQFDMLHFKVPDGQLKLT